MQVVEDYNANDDVHGILVQLPLPKHINETAILDAISLEKDVDGFHPFNIGSLAMRGRDPLFVSCTPKVCTHQYSVSVRFHHMFTILSRGTVCNPRLSPLLSIESLHAPTSFKSHDYIRNSPFVLTAVSLCWIQDSNTLQSGLSILKSHCAGVHRAS